MLLSEAQVYSTLKQIPYERYKAEVEDTYLEYCKMEAMADHKERLKHDEEYAEKFERLEYSGDPYLAVIRPGLDKYETILGYDRDEVDKICRHGYSKSWSPMECVDAIEAYLDKGSAKNSDIPEWHKQDNDGTQTDEFGFQI